MGELDGRSFIVTGGGTGIGAGIARRLAVAGAEVTICGRTAAKLEAAAGSINHDAGRDAVRWHVADVTDEADVRRVVAAAIERSGRVHGAVANAGGGGDLLPLHLQRAEEFRRVLDLNVVGTFLLLKHLVPHFARSGGGSFVGMSSIAGHLTHPNFGAYGPSKVAIEMLCRSAADEYGEVGIRVNAVRPGLTMSELMGFVSEDGFGSQVHASYMAETPLGGASEVSDVAEAVAFLLSDRASRISGQVLGIDGGQTVRRGPDWTSLVLPRIGGREVALGLADPPTA